MEIPGTSLKLCYLSSRTSGYLSPLRVIMTPAIVPLSLAKVHLTVAVEGHLLQKWFHASPNLAYTYIWDKTDAYKQRVYGITEALGTWYTKPQKRQLGMVRVPPCYRVSCQGYCSFSSAFSSFELQNTDSFRV